MASKAGWFTNCRIDLRLPLLKRQRMKLFDALWPPLEAFRSNRTLHRTRVQAGTQNLWKEIADQTAASVKRHPAKTAELLEYSKAVAESEAKRKETIENKASVVLQASGISASIVGIAPTLLGKQWNAP